MFIRLAMLISLAFIPFAVWGQWTQMNVPLTAGWGSEIEAVDYDLDGDLDLFLCGSTSPAGNGYSNLYRNDGSWNFTLINTGIVGVYRGFSAWADYNNDGFMDVVITGKNNESSPPVAKLYIGTAQHTFTYITTNWTGLNYSWVDAGDYNNDGLIDVIMTGINNGVDYVKLYRNEGDLVFTEVFAGIQNMSAGQSHFVDYDNDGDLDISVMGSGACIIYRNDGTDTFTDIEVDLEPLRLSSSDWGDFDNDGFPDLVTSGQGYITHSYLYKNHGEGSFTQLECPIPGIIAGSLFWGDYDNDGLLDILVTGAFFSYGTKITRIYKNNGDRTFTQQTTNFPLVSSSKAIWADLDNDGNLDVIVAGFDGSSYEARIYRNNNTTANTAPTPPTIVFDQASSTICFTGATDTSTPASGLSYNLRIGTTPGGDDVFSVLENPLGYRRTVNPGRQKFYFEPDQLQTYYASAQAIDNTFMGSAFGAELAFNLQGIPMIAITDSDSISFGGVSVGANSTQQAVHITNTGTSVLRLNGTSFTTTGLGFQVLTTGFPFQIPPGQRFDILLRFSPLSVGTFNTTLNIFSNAINSPLIQVPLSGSGIYNPIPATVTNVNISTTSNSVHLSWAPVSTDVNGNPITVDRYVVLFSEVPDPDLFWYLGNTTTTEFTHFDVALCADSMMYRVKAVKFPRGFNARILDSFQPARKIAWEDIAKLTGLREEKP